MSPKDRPLLAITMGDAAGVGPEIVVKALADPQVIRICRPLVIGDMNLLERHRARFAQKLRLAKVEWPGAPSKRVYPVVEPFPIPSGEPVVGTATAEAGRAAVAYIEKGVELVAAGAADALVTAPINKTAIRLAGSPFPGHTEMLAHLTGAREYAMMLVGGALRVSLATIHIPLSRVPVELDTGRILSVIRLTARAAASMGFTRPRVAVCGLNPHAGEEGLFGREDMDIIRPAVEAAAAEGLEVSGPHPADTVFHRALRGEFQAVVAMYHDQGLVPLKTLFFDEGVNVTLGLPIIRTSVDHGTAYNIAGQGVASPRSLVEAIKLAALMAGHRPGGRM